MRFNGKLVLVDDPRDDRRRSERFLMNGVRIARWFGHDLLIFSRKFRSSKALETLSEKEIGGRSQWIFFGGVRSLESYGETLVAELEAVREAGVVLLGVSREEIRAERLQGWKVRLLQSSHCPVLLLPFRFRFRRGGFESFFVPMSGESRSNTALDWAIRRGSELEVPVDILHATEETPGPEREEVMIRRVGDEFHHEYPRLVEEFIAQASPFTTPRQKRVIRDFRHCSGDPIAMVLSQLKRKRPGVLTRLLVLEWKGRFEAGRALLVKRMIRRGDFPILLVRQGAACHTRLKVGGDSEAA